MSLIISFDNDFTKVKILSEVFIDTPTLNALMIALQKPITDIMDKEDKDWGYDFVSLYQSKHHIDLSELNNEAFNEAYHIIMDKIAQDVHTKYLVNELREKFEADPRYESGQSDNTQ